MMNINFYIVTPIFDSVPDEIEIIGSLDDDGEFAGDPGTLEHIQDVVERFALDLKKQEDREMLMIAFRGSFSFAREEIMREHHISPLPNEVEEQKHTMTQEQADHLAAGQLMAHFGECQFTIRRILENMSFH